MFSNYAYQVQTVSELTCSIKGLLETEFPFVTVTGEISNLRRPHSGHLYFTLKDDAAQLKAVLFKLQQRYLAETPKDGMQVVCRGRISVYEPRGDYQLIADTMEFQGAGSLQIAFENLKKRLAEEGLFDAGHKKELPFLPRKITLITSPDGAAVHDFIKVAQNRFPAMPIEIFPVRVQGDGAAEDIVQAVKTINAVHATDIIVLCRGGGSIEDLWPFNEEKTARAIYDSEIPIVSAVGHEIDFTIADFVADLRAPTPSAAAEIIIPERRNLHEKIQNITNRLSRALVRAIDLYRHRYERLQQKLTAFSATVTHNLLLVDSTETALLIAHERYLQKKRNDLNKVISRLQQQNPLHVLSYQKKLVAKAKEQLLAMMQVQLQRKKTFFVQHAQLLDAVNPRAVLGRGYSIVTSEKTGKLVRSSMEVTKGDALQVVLHQGTLGCQVTQIKK